MDFNVHMPNLTQSSFIEDITFSFSFFCHHMPNEDNYYVQQFRHQMSKFAILKVEFLFDIWLTNRAGQVAHTPLVHLGIVSYIYMLVYSINIVLMDMIAVKPTQNTFLYIKTSVVLLYRAQPTYMVLVSILHSRTYQSCNISLLPVPVRYGT